MGNSKIEWTEQTWNPIVGCSVVSPGCTNCYAMKMAARCEAMGLPQYKGVTKPSKAGAVWTGELRLVEDALTAPLRRRKPTTYFVNSMSDLFHESVPDAWIDRVFTVMALSPQHTFQVLTKRSARMRAYLTQLDQEPVRDTLRRVMLAWPARIPIPEDGITFPLPNLWLGVSAEDQTRADERVPDLLATPAAVRFVSAEPLLGPIDFTMIWLRRGGERTTELSNRLGDYVQPLRGNFTDSPRLDWIIVGGESGPNARPMHPAWARAIRDQCAAAGVAFHFKQHGAWAPTAEWYADHPVSLPIRAWTGTEWTDDGSRADLEWVARVGKKAAGRLLDGVEHNGMPEVHHG